MRHSTAVVALFAAALTAAVPGSALELPGIGTLLGTDNPLDIFPERLPQFAYAGLRFDALDLYTARKGSQRQAYGAWQAHMLGLTKSGPVWLGFRAEAGRLNLLQRDVHDLDDALDGRRDDRGVSGAIAFDHGRWRARMLVGTADRPEGAIQVTHAPGSASEITARAWVWRSSLDLSQSIDGTTFYFPFDYRDRCVEIDATTEPIANHRLIVHAGHKTLVGEKTYPDQHNLLYVTRLRSEATLSRESGPRLDVSGLWERSEFNLAMTVDGTRYLEARDLGLDRWRAEGGWRPTRALRLAAGMEQWTLRSKYPGFFEAWPFTAWDVFATTRYRLEAVDKVWRIRYLRAAWHSSSVRSLAFRLDGRFEWWSDHGMLRWKERVPVFSPFFFRYDHHETSIDWPFTHGVQLDASLRFRPLPGWALSVGGQLQFPFGDERAAHSAAPAEDPPVESSGPTLESGQRGGLRLRTALEIAW